MFHTQSVKSNKCNLCKLPTVFWLVQTFHPLCTGFVHCTFLWCIHLWKGCLFLHSSLHFTANMVALEMFRYVFLQGKVLPQHVAPGLTNTGMLHFVQIFWFFSEFPGMRIRFYFGLVMFVDLIKVLRWNMGFKACWLCSCSLVSPSVFADPFSAWWGEFQITPRAFSGGWEEQSVRTSLLCFLDISASLF